LLDGTEISGLFRSWKIAGLPEVNLRQNGFFIFLRFTILIERLTFKESIQIVIGKKVKKGGSENAFC